MPKDPTKNIFQYKIRGGHLNEFEFQQNQGAVTEQKERPWEKQDFDPNAKTPEAPVKPERKGGKGANGKLKPGTLSTNKQPAKAAKKAPKKTGKKSATPTRKSAAKKSTSRKAGTTRRAKKATKK